MSTRGALARMPSWALAVVLFPVLVPGLVACGEQQASSQAGSAEPIPAAARVDVVELQAVRWSGTLTTFGVIEALEEVDVAAELGGTVLAVYVSEGDRVEAGQLLLELDPEKRELVLRQARQSAQQARTALDEARLKLERRQELAQLETISKEVLDNARLSLDSASAAYERALASQRLAERELRDTRITSPTEGLVDVKSVEPGESVALGARLITLQAVSALQVHTWVSENDVSYISSGATAEVSLSSLPGQTYPALVEWVGVNADPMTGNFPVKLILQEAAERLRPGMTATARIQAAALEDVLLLPEGALLDRDRRRVVFVVEDGRAVMRAPQLAAGFTDQHWILSGLKAGDQVVVSGQSRLIDGSPVAVGDQ